MRNLMFAAAAAMTAAAVTPAMATNFSFAGNLIDASSVLYFNFSVGTASDVTLRTYSYAGGTNAAGTVISAGGFDPILSLYNSSGTRIGQNDDGGANVPADPNTGAHYDTYLLIPQLAAGSYTVAVSAFNAFCGASISDPCGTGNLNNRTTAFAFDVLGADQATGPGGSDVPEPASWAMFIGGFGLVGSALRRKKATVSFA